MINEPTAADTLRILQGVKELYEKHHHVVLPDDVLKAAVDYSIQYIPQRTLPDKAIDLIDMTAAHLAAKIRKLMLRHWINALKIRSG